MQNMTLISAQFQRRVGSLAAFCALMHCNFSPKFTDRQTCSNTYLTNQCSIILYCQVIICFHAYLHLSPMQYVLHYNSFMYFALCSLSCDPDGIDHEDSYPLQSSRHHHSSAKSHWDDGCSCGSSCSQSSGDLPNILSHHAKVELGPPKNPRRNDPPTVLQLIPQSGSSVGREAILNIGHQGRWI